MRTLTLLIFAVGLAHGEETWLKAGLARVELTPSNSMPMYGYAKRKCGDANGTHDPLWAKALVLEAGGTRMAIVTLDLGSFASERLKADVASKLGIQALLLAASHTHSGPRFLPGDEGGEAPAYMAEIERKVFGAVEEASRSMFPARLSTGRGSVQLGYNRLRIREDGRARALFENPERVPYGPVDPEFMLLRVEDSGGKPRALLVHYATHAVVLGPSNCKYSADYPGVMQSRIETALPGVQAMFVQGAAGDINPLFMARSGDERADFAVVAKMGETLASEALRVVKTMKPAAEGPIRFQSETLTFRDRWEKGRTIAVGLTTALIGQDVAIAAIPGEPLHRLQTEWKRRATVAFPLFYGYTWSGTGGWPGYIPDLESAARGGYGADASTRIEIGAGERMVDQHLINLYGLLGMWKEQPGRP